MKMDIRAIQQKIKEIEKRKLTPLEHGRLKRLTEADEKIYKLHKGLKENEQRFLSYESIFSENLKEEINFQPKFLKTKLLKYQNYGLFWMKNREKILNGGILADEMGLGKTLQILALILSGSSDEVTLVITPAIALTQWINEIKKHAPDVFNVSLYYGMNRNLNDVFENCDVKNNGKFKIILSTYGTIESEYRRKGNLYQYTFHRVVIDEAHAIKDTKSSTNTAIGSIKTKNRWAITGTPVQNRVCDLYSLVKFLKLDPHSYYFCKKCECKTTKWLENGTRKGFCGCGHFSATHFSWWNRRIINMIKEYGFTEKSAEVFLQLEKITSHILLRRTKDFLQDELGLPPKNIEIIRCYFSEDEKEFYQNLYSGTKKQIMAYKAVGQITNNYANIFTLLQKMRLAVNHPYLITKQSFYPICGYCNDEADDPVMSNCKHIFCREEVKIFMSQSTKCPVCKVKMSINLLENDFNDDSNENDNFFSSYFPISDWMSSSKIEKLIQKLYEQKKDYFLEKTIIFSQFVTFLELMRWKLERSGFKCLKIYGSMPFSQRKAAIECFNKNPEYTILLISLKAGGVALDLTEASTVFIMDLWWNPAVEEQAMDRIHRIGQNRPVKIYKIIIQDSIESRILILQQKKKALQKTAIQNDKQALESLTEEDLIFLFS